MDVDGGSTHEKDANVDREKDWRGCSMGEIHNYLNEFELEHIGSVKPSSNHTVLHQYPIRGSYNEPPLPLKSHSKWDAVHVRLPCSSKSQYPVTAPDGTSSIQSRWEMIEKALLCPIANSRELQSAILSYNSKYEGQWNFRALHRLFDEELDESEARVFFEDLLPRVIRLALRLPELVQAPIPLLKQGRRHSITLTQQQVSCLLANAFLCTFPRRNTLKRKSEYSTFPDINFNRLFESSGRSVLEKLKCICHYFRRVCPTERDATNVPIGVVTFERRSLHGSEMPNWAEIAAPIGATPLHITSTGTIEDQGIGLLQVDFANKYLGGGVLGSGCVQEEIRFVICPELLISKLFTECLRPTEALLMVGCERYSNYTGYANSFQWAGNYDDSTPRDSSRRRLTHIVAIDALAFVQSSHQYREELMMRELNKAYVGFLHTLQTPAPGIASGNWGCGAFGGEAKLKALLQLMVCTVTKRSLVYYTFGNAELRDEVHCMHNFIIEENVLVKDLWSVLRKFQSQQLQPKQLYNFIYTEIRRMKSNYSPNPSTSLKIQPLNKKKSNYGLSIHSNTEELVTAAATPASSRLSSSSSSIQPCALISDDESDALLLAAVCETPSETFPSEHVTNKASNLLPGSSPSKSGVVKRSRQRTLLELLDQCYTANSNLSVSKRRCHEKAE